MCVLLLRQVSVVTPGSMTDESEHALSVRSSSLATTDGYVAHPTRLKLAMQPWHIHPVSSPRPLASVGECSVMLCLSGGARRAWQPPYVARTSWGLTSRCPVCVPLLVESGATPSGGGGSQGRAHTVDPAWRC
jgi:hypothetical protein